MIPLNPQNLATSITPEELKQHQSIAQVLMGNVDMGTPTANNPATTGVNAGVYTKFNQGNGSGILIRIAANGVANTGAAYNWGTTGAGIVINHGLLRQPIGYHVVDQDKDVRVYRTAAPDKNQITLTSTDNTASVTVYIF